MNPPALRRRAAAACALAGAAALTGAVLAAVGSSSAGAAAATTGTFLPTNGRWTVSGHGNGHGHGLSQYGAYGRALAGQSAATILGFYYPNTSYAASSAAVANRKVRVQLSDLPAFPTVTPAAGLSVTGVGALPTAGVQAYRLVPNGKSALGLQAERGGRWATTKGGLPATSAFSSSTGALSVVESDGSVGSYRGTLSATRSGNSVNALNIVTLDDYVRGVVTNESPSSWPAAALQAQAVAARTYALFAVNEHSAADAFDLCDTSSCQVYRGRSSETATGNAAVSATAGRVMTYQGAAAFTQFSSSNGGWTFDGGKPYLVARADPYDTSPTDPWANWTRTGTTAQVASYYGLDSVTSIAITGRNGHGDWGGAVTSAVVNGVRGGRAVSVAATGNGLAGALNLPLSWFTLSNGKASSGGDGTASAGSAAVPSVPTSVFGHPAPRSVTFSWQPPAGTATVTGYVVMVGGRTTVVAAGARRVTVGGLTDGKPYTATVAAQSSAGTGPVVTVRAVPGAVPAHTPAAPTAASVWSGNHRIVIRWSSLAVAPTNYVVSVSGGGRHVLPGTANSTMFVGLTNGKPVTVTVRAVNAYGAGAVLLVPAASQPTPIAPGALRAVAGSRSISVSWAAPGAGSPGPVTGYLVTVLGTTKTLVPATQRSVRITGLVTGRRYTIAVLAGTKAGQGAAALTSVTAG